MHERVWQTGLRWGRQLLFLACACAFFWCEAASAATYTWNGGAGTWTTAGAWSGSTWANGNDALFVGTGGTVAATSSGTATGITFASTAGTYALSLNNGFVIGTGGVTANQDATISQSNYLFPIVASSTQAWTVASGKTLTMDFGATSARVNNGAGTVLTKAGDGTLAIKGGFPGSAFEIYSGNTFRLTAGKVTIAAPSPGLLNNGTFTISGGELATGSAATTSDLAGAGTFNLDGGVISNVRRFYNASGTATFNFNGGTIRSGTNYSGNDFFATAATLNVKAGGAIFDTNGFNVDVNRQFTEDPTSTGGGLTKQGAGTLTLGFSGTLGYTGETRVEGGVLTLNANPRLASTRLNVVSGTFSYSAAGATAVPTLTRLSGGGTIVAPAGATITVGSSGTFAPGGTTLGTLSITTASGTANLSLNAVSNTTIRLGAPGTSYSSPGSSDGVTLTGSLGLGGTINLVNDANASNLGSAAGGTYRIATFGTSGGSMAIGTNIAGTRALATNQGSGTAAGKGLFVDVYNLASATTAQTISIGNMRAGSTKTAAVTLGNTAPTNATYTETLSTGSFSSTSANFTTSGSAGGIAGGASGTGTLVVGLGSGLSAGAASGTTVLSLFSNAVNGSGFVQQAVGSQTITITGGVYDYANAKYTGATLDFGVVHQGASVSNQTLAIGNQAVTNASYQDLLNVSGSSSNSAVSVTGFDNLAASANGATTNNLMVGVSTAAAGSLSGTVSLNLVSNANGVSGLTNGTATIAGGGAITTTGAVFSGTATWNVAGGGAWGIQASGTNWTSTDGVQAAPGTFAGYTNVDAATFGGVLASGTGTILLNGATPSLAAIVFSNTTGRYVIDTGTGAGSLTLAALSGKPTMNVVAGGAHEIKTSITGSNGLSKIGAGTLVLSGSNGYTGGTDVAAGSLLVNGFIGGSVSVASGALLGGSGSFGGLVTVSGTLSPGNSPGEITLASLVLTSTATTLIQIQGLTRGSQYDAITVTDAGGLTYGGSLLFDFASPVADNSTFDIFSFGGSSSGSFGSVASTGAYAGTWTNNNDGTYSFAQGSQTLTFSQSTGDIIVVPEPQAVALALCGGGAAGYRLLKRRRR